ncbi:hypothetical protein BC332_24715 [Capsicum chinense]|uniref:DUF985 domain-containing protein n=1 Tax=Capsicum annuum TaxID=4072 RepID=A0A1U8DZ76_CAPAN|nr:uncharacterized protein LOC107840895 [Capsicum annuum]KAF3625083.1 Small nuclear ribonucleoprotein family protein isoform 1 [Capsicum annuum]KAF3648551.1 Small nuclear ribonucleoprotein family protein isoform 1 [Capsicum annuum]PHT73604.1 hypothetical protein T459_24389 [Capsicum annuum]PHU08226.1 hypothetical protein BC332_24715 [Capsicum chinense]
MATASKIVEKLNLKPHPEGGFYSETFRDNTVILSKSNLPPTYKVDRPVSTCIYFLLPSGSASHLHRIPCAETWHFYMGEPITVMELNETDGKVKLTCLGPDPLVDDQLVQYTVPPNVWFGAFPTRDYNITSDMQVTKAPTRDSEKHFSLVGCTCAPAFQFDDFELAKRSDLVSRYPAHESLLTLLAFSD